MTAYIEEHLNVGAVEIRRSPFTGGGTRAYEIHDLNNDRVYFCRYGRAFDTVEEAIVHYEELLKPRGFFLSSTCEPWPEQDEYI